VRILYNNKVDDADAITSSTEEGDYPDTNIQTTSLTEVWRATSCASEYIQVDAGSGATFTADTVAVAGHNISSSATITLTAGSSTTVIVSSPSVTETVTYREGIMLKYFTSTADRYWRLTIADAANTDGYVEVGRLGLGAYLEMDPSSLVEFPMEKLRTDNVAYSITNQIYGDKGEAFLKISYDFPRTSASAKSAVETFYDDVGLHTPFFFSNFTSDFTIIEPIYAVLGEPITFNYIGHGYFTFGTVIREVG